MIKKDIMQWWKDYKLNRFKPRMNCTLEELIKKFEKSKNLIYTLLFTTILISALIMELWITQNKVSIMFNTVWIICFIILSSEIKDSNNLQLFIYLKRKENIQQNIENITKTLTDKNLLIDTKVDKIIKEEEK